MTRFDAALHAFDIWNEGQVDPQRRWAAGVEAALAASDKWDRDNPRDHERPVDMTEHLTEAIHHLLWIWYQYGGGATDGKGSTSFPHQAMQAGERATDFLVKFGLGRDQGWQFELNRRGVDIMNLDGSSVPYPDEGNAL